MAVRSVLHGWIVGMALGCGAAPGAAGESGQVPFLTMPDRDFFDAAIEKERRADNPAGVTGITVPHHLLAADLIARGFWAASGGQYDRIILLAPDHYRLVESAFAVAETVLETPFGPVEIDTPALHALRGHPDFATHPQPAIEHGIMGLAPFIEAFFPDTPVIPVIAAIHTGPEAWQRGVEALRPLIGPRTLVIQSTDYSHYLPYPVAIQRDQETLAVLATGQADPVSDLLQPDHMDSKAAQFIQTALQRELGGHGVVVANRNAAEYGAGLEETTSYITTVFLRDPSQGAALAYDDHERVFFAGDTLLGRYFEPALLDAGKTGAIVASVRKITAGAPLIVNLEGVMLDEPPIGQTPFMHAMLEDLALPVLTGLGVIGAGLANNHALDFGHEGLARTRSALVKAGIAALEPGAVRDFGAFRLLPLNFIGDQIGAQPPLTDPAQLDFVCDLNAAPPLVAFVHWGLEYTDTPRERERQAAARLAECGVVLTIGAHSHRHAQALELVGGGESHMLFSLGNFLFDQRRPDSSGALLELRVFRQGTVASRVIPIPNYFAEALP